METLLLEGGFADVAVESRPMTIDFDSTEEYWETFTDMAAGVKEKIALLSEIDRERLRALIEDAAAAHRTRGRLRLTATPLCASAVK